MSVGIGAHLRYAPELVDQSIRASRVASVRAEKALHMARALERRSRDAGNGTLYLAEARRLRADAVEHTLEARRHREAAEALRAWAPRGELA